MTVLFNICMAIAIMAAVILVMVGVIWAFCTAMEVRYENKIKRKRDEEQAKKAAEQLAR